MWVKTSVPLFCSCAHREKPVVRTEKVNAEVEENICFKWSRVFVTREVQSNGFSSGLLKK